MFNLPEIKIWILLCIGNDTVGAECPRLERNYRGAAGAELSVPWMPGLHSQPFISAWPADRIRSSFRQPTASGGWLLLHSFVTVTWGVGRESPTFKIGHIGRIILVYDCPPASTAHFKRREAGSVVTNKRLGDWTFLHYISFKTAYNWDYYNPGTVLNSSDLCGLFKGSSPTALRSELTPY